MNISHIYPEPNRKEALGTNGVIATAHPLATGAALRILQDGGNAFDAAAAITASLAVVEPYGSGLGGGGFWLLHRSKDNKNVVLDGRETAPMRSHINMYVDKNGNIIF